VSIALKLKALLGGESPEPMSSSELLALAAKEPVHEVIDFGQHHDDSPVPRLVRLILMQAIFDSAEQIRFCLEDESLKEGLRVSLLGHGAKTDLGPMHGCLYSGILVVLCNHAAVSYYAKGRVTGLITTGRPDSVWLLEADDLRKGLVLSRTR